MKSNRQKGIAQLVVVAVMAFLALGLPLTTKLVQQNQENRSQAAFISTADGGEVRCKVGESFYDVGHIFCNKANSQHELWTCQPSGIWNKDTCQYGCEYGKKMCNVKASCGTYHKKSTGSEPYKPEELCDPNSTLQSIWATNQESMFKYMWICKVKEKKLNKLFYL
jgi:hypothetical protein